MLSHSGKRKPETKTPPALGAGGVNLAGAIMTAKSDQRDAIVDELLRHGIKVEEYGNGGKHPWLMFRAPNGARMKMIYIRGTTTDRHIANARAEVRRKMRALGIQPLEVKGEKLRAEPVPIKAKPFEMPPLTEKTKPVGYVETMTYELPDDQPSMFPAPVSVAPPAASPAPIQEAKAMTEAIPGRKERVTMSRPQIVKAAALLGANSSERNGARSYNHGFSDATIAKMTRTDEAPIDQSHIATLRLDLFPDWKLINQQNAETPTRAQLFELIKDMRTRIEALEAIATTPDRSEYSSNVVKRLREMGAAE